MKTWKWRVAAAKATGFTCISFMLINPLTVSAAQQTGPFGLQGAIVSDAELSAMRGRFVDGRKVTFFGIKMRTQWLFKDKSAFDMEMHMNFDLSQKRYRPNMRMFHSRNLGAAIETAGQPQQSPLDNVSDNGALENISGVVQNIQVAGDGNSVHNGVDWLVTDQAVVPETEGLIELSDSGVKQHQNDDGVNTQLSADASGVGYQVSVPDVGTVSQKITRSQFSGGNILQSTQLNSDLNQVLNRIGLTVELSPVISGVRLQRFHRALDSLRGL